MMKRIMNEFIDLMSGKYFFQAVSGFVMGTEDLEKIARMQQELNKGNKK